MDLDKSPFDQLAAWMGIHPDWLVFAGTVFGIVFGVLGSIFLGLYNDRARWVEKHVEDKKQPEQRLPQLNKDYPEDTDAGPYYRERLTRWLHRWHHALDRHPWAKTFDWTLLAALLYPMAAILIFWVFSGVNTSGVPGLFLPPEQTSLFSRLLGLLFVLSAAGCWWQFGRASSAWQWLWATVAAAAGWIGTKFIGAFAVGVAVALGLAVVGAGAVAVAGAGAAAVAVAVAVVGAVAVAYDYLTDSDVLPSRIRQPVVRLLLLLVLFLMTCIGAVIAGRFGADYPFIGPLLVFLAMLPLINAVFDSVSLEVTRRLLTVVSQAEQWWLAFVTALADLGLAALFLLALTWLMPLSVILLNGIYLGAGGAEPLLNLLPILDPLCHRPRDPAIWWVYVTLFTTLLPSAAHLLLATYWIFSAFPDRGARIYRIRKEVLKDRDGLEDIERRQLTLRMTLHRFMPLVFGLLVTMTVPFLLWSYSFGWLPALAAFLRDQAVQASGYGSCAAIAQLVAGG